MSQVGSPASRNAIAGRAVSSVATQGTSARERRASRRGSSPSSASCISVREAPANGCSVPWNMFSIMNPIAAARAALPNTGAKVGPRTCARSCCRVSGPSTPSQTTGNSTK